MDGEFSFSVPSHTLRFGGYLDAVGRHYTDEKRLCALNAALMPSRILDNHAIKTTTPVENMVKEFERDISQFLSTDPRNRLLFYLTEYFCWYKEFSDACVCEKLGLEGGGISRDHTAYRLFVDHKHVVLFLAYWKDKAAMPDQSL
jgi:hypothetical protein